MHPHLQGILWMVIVALVSSLLYGVVRHLSEFIPSVQIVFLYNATALSWLLPYMWFNKELPGKLSHYRLSILRAFLEFCAWSISFVAITMLPLPAFSALTFINPLFLATMAVFIFREPHNRHTWLALCFGLVGVLIVSRPGTGVFEVGAVLMIIAALCFSVCGIIIKHLTKQQPVSLIAFQMLFFTTIIAAPFALYQWKPLEYSLWKWIIIMGFLSCTQQLAVTKAFSKTRLTIILPFSFLGLVFTSIIAYLAFDEMVEGWTVAGAAIILASSVYARYNAVQDIKKDQKGKQ